MSTPDSPSLPERSPPSRDGNILLYLPWEFDMLGGVDVVVDRLWKGLEKSIPGRAIIGIQDWHFQGEKTDDEGRRFLHLNLPAPPSAKGPAAWRYRLTLAKRIPQLLRTLRQQRITTINAHFPTLNSYVLALLKQYGLWQGRLVLSFHGSDVNDIDPANPHWRLIARHTDAITACSAALAKRVDDLRLFGMPTTVIYNGIDSQSFADQAGPIPEGIRTPYILNVGNYVPRKGQDVLLKAFAEIARDYPDLGLVCVGGSDNGKWLQYLSDLSVKLQIAHRVTLLENQSQSSVAGLMKNSLCLAHTASNEPFGLVLIEAAACSTPIIATRVGGIPEIITSDEYGLLVDAGDTLKIAQAICKTLNFPEATINRSGRCLENINSKFSTDKMVSSYQYTLIKKHQPSIKK